MAAPSATVRSAPAGIKLEDGFSTKITFALDPDISFWEKTVQPPSLDGGDPIDTTTMHNVDWRTKAPRQLITSGDGSSTVAYDPAVYSQILAIVNRPTTITYTLPDGSSYAIYGFLQKFEPSALAEGEMPEATVTIVHTNWDATNRVEAAPVLTSVSGT